MQIALEHLSPFRNVLQLALQPLSQCPARHTHTSQTHTAQQTHNKHTRGSNREILECRLLSNICRSFGLCCSWLSNLCRSFLHDTHTSQTHTAQTHTRIHLFGCSMSQCEIVRSFLHTVTHTTTQSTNTQQTHTR